MKRNRVLVIPVAVVAAASLCAGAKGASPGRIAFAAASGIASMNPDGSGQWGVELTAGDTAPAWSPDGSKLAVESSRGGDADVFVMDPDGSNAARLTWASGSERDPAWSPDGKEIAFTSTRDWYSPQIYVMRADGSGQTQITDDRYLSDEHPTWSPDGTRIAFASWRWPDGYDIYVVGAGGGVETRLTTDPAVDENPAWSPDGKHIAFDSDRVGNLDVYVMNADGSGIKRLTDSPGADTHPAWSPDGMEIAFQSDRAAKPASAVYVMSADGSNVRQLTGGGSSRPAWQPLAPGPGDCTLWGTPGNDLLVGTEGNDTICGLGGNDTILGLGGLDSLLGGPGNDRLAGGQGIDLLEGGPGNDRLDARDGLSDTVYGGTGIDYALVDAGLDGSSGVEKKQAGRDVAAWRPVLASSFEPTSPPARAVDGRPDDWWSSGDAAPGWIQVDLLRPTRIARIRLLAALQLEGIVNRILVAGPGTHGAFRLLYEFRGPTYALQPLSYAPPKPWRGIRYVRVEARAASDDKSWVSWPEIQVFAPVR